MKKTNNKFSVQNLVNRAIRGDNSDEPIRVKGEIKNWRASGLGSCMTGRYLARLGKEPDEPFDERTLRVFSVGRMMEDWIVNLIKQEKGVEVDTQGFVEDKKNNITGHYDAKVTVDGVPIIYEFKTKHSKSFWYMDKKKEGANEQHKMQLWTYLWLSGVEEGRILYMSKDDLAILEFPIYRKDEKIRKMVEWELKVLNTAWKKKLPPQPISDPRDWRIKYCRWHKQCKKILKSGKFIKVKYKNK